MKQKTKTVCGCNNLTNPGQYFPSKNSLVIFSTCLAYNGVIFTDPNQSYG